MYQPFHTNLTDDLAAITAAGTYKHEHVMESPQGRTVTVNGKEYLNFCANNYLGLAGTKLLEEEADRVLKEWGYGLASVRFICGTQSIHKELERKVANVLGTEDAVLYSSCYMANIGLMQTFFTADDAIISDSLNHASIIDGVRLTKADRHIYDHLDMASLEEKLQATQDKRYRLIATDGVFSMDGHIAPLKEIVALAKKYNALIYVDDAHATGVMGATGRGTAEAEGVLGEIDFITCTFGKALGGAGGAAIGTSAKAADFLRQKSRSYLFSNSLDTVITGLSIFVIDYLQTHPELLERLWANTSSFRTQMKAAGFQVSDAPHPITPIMLGDEQRTTDMAAALFTEGIYAVGFSYPVVPPGSARIRVQISAAHTPEDIDHAVAVFTKVGQQFGAI